MKTTSVALLLLLACTLPVAAAPQDNIVGQASVIDGDTLEIHGARIRLFGVDAPESDQTCHDDDGKLYRCGQKAANDLSDFIGAKTVSCVPQATDRYDRTVAVCSVGTVDLADWLVRQGLAFDWPQYSKGKYAAAQKEAERTGDGMWGGQWVVPWRYRECKRAGGSPIRCSESAAAQ
ncbi:thermonuclease family protein [Rhodopseudomonas sp. RCAM05734]|uniref:thermonuclease family protein n=1 Tax=Rhodopseudomonas sp. RCAM05734 TaxID=3457549 RepID=UPI0040446A43